MPRVKYEWIDASEWKPGYVAEQWPMFAFGSNLDVGQLMRRAPNAVFVSTARINHARMWFVGHGKKTGCGVATLRPTGSHDGFAVGVLFKMTAADVANMDTFEGNGRSYKRTLVTVAGSNGKPVRAFAYLHTSELINAPSPQYVTTITAGFRFWGFDLDLLRAAVKRSPGSRLPDPRRRGSWVDNDRLPVPFDYTDSSVPKTDPVLEIGPLQYRTAPGGGYYAIAKYTPPAGRPRSTPDKPAQAKAYRRDGKPLNPESENVQPQDCDCPNYRKNCTWSGCPRFDNRDLAGEGK